MTMKNLQKIVGLAALGIVSTLPLSAQEPRPMPPASETKIDYDTHIKPILDKSCTECHCEAKVKSKLRLDTRDFVLKGGVEGPSVVVGDSENSNLIKILLGTLPDYETMPPADEHEPLTDEEIGLLRAWIDQGLVWGAAETPAAFPTEAAVPGFPADWKVQATLQDGPLATWGLIKDFKGPDGEQAIGLTAHEAAKDETISLLWTPKADFQDGNISLKVKATGGKFTAGIAARIKDTNNYYCIFLDWINRSMSLRLVKDGKLSVIAEQSIDDQFPEWVPLSISFTTNLISIKSDPIGIVSENSVFPDAGGVGYVCLGDTTAAFTAFQKSDGK